MIGAGTSAYERRSKSGKGGVGQAFRGLLPTRRNGEKKQGEPLLRAVNNGQSESAGDRCKGAKKVLRKGLFWLQNSSNRKVLHGVDARGGMFQNTEWQI